MKNGENCYLEKTTPNGSNGLYPHAHLKLNYYNYEDPKYKNRDLQNSKGFFYSFV